MKLPFSSWLAARLDLLKSIDYEQIELGRQIDRLAARQIRKSLRVLDVGCGYGRNMRFLQQRGHEVTGIDVNPDIVAANRAAGLRAFRADETALIPADFDVLLCSHVIEHFAPEALLSFLNGWLDRVAPGGHLVILTPLMSPLFYVDFDHVKPYLPEGILMVFGGDEAQVQYRSRHRLRLVDLWYRRNWWRPQHVRAWHFPSPWRKPLRALEALSVLAFSYSGTRIGRVDAWLGVFTKT